MNADRYTRTRPAPATIALRAAAALLAAGALAPPAPAQCALSFPNGTVSYPVPSQAEDIAVADLNGDGQPDLAVARYSGPSPGVSVLLGNPGGTFQPAVNYATVGSQALSLTVADFNTDGALDLATNNWQTNTISLWRGNGDGTFQPALNSPAGFTPGDVAAADFNADGKPDLAVTNNFFNSNIVKVLLGNGDGTFQPGVSYTAGTNPYSIIAADFNADGYPDLAVANYGSVNVSVMINNGDGTLQAAVNYPAAGLALVARDLNADGRPDLAVAGGGFISIFRGNGNGTFQAPVLNSFPSGIGPTSVGAADLNDDGLQDLVATASDGGVYVLLANWNYTYQAPAVRLSNVAGSVAIASGDFNSDGRPDLAAGRGFPYNVGVSLNFTPSPVAITQQPTYTAALAGQSAAFTVAATGAGTITYQWRRNGLNLADGGPISGATTPTLTINPVDLADNGAAFDCILTNNCRSITSHPAGLSVTPACHSDYNGDGFVDGIDYDQFNNDFEAGC